jgi:predicted porin
VVVTPGTAPTTPSVPAKEEKKEEKSEDDGLGPYVTMGLGVGLIVLGAVFSSDADDADGNGPAPVPDSDDKRIAAGVLYGMGGVLVAAGATLLVIQLLEDGESKPAAQQAGLFSIGESLAVTPTVTSSGAGLGAVFRF